MDLFPTHLSSTPWKIDPKTIETHVASRKMAQVKVVYYLFRILSYAAGTGALACYLGGPALHDWMYVLVGVSFTCFVITFLLMVWLRLRR